MALRNPIRALSTISCLLLGALLLNGCSGTDRMLRSSGLAYLTPITATPTHRHHPGRIVWHDLLTTDAAAASKFYGGLFGWSFVQTDGYVEIYGSGHKLGGIVEVEAGGQSVERGAEWLLSMSVGDVDEAAARAKALGGTVVNGPLDMPKRGRGALIRDPLGAHLVLLHARDGDPEERRAAPGDWLWNEIWTNRPQETVAFYRAVGGYDQVDESSDYAILIRQGKWRAGVRFSGEDDATIRWVPVVRVADPDALLASVERLGGVVWIRPEELPGDNDTALISDNAGALLILQRWTFADEQGGR